MTMVTLGVGLHLRHGSLADPGMERERLSRSGSRSPTTLIKEIVIDATFCLCLCKFNMWFGGYFVSIFFVLGLKPWNPLGPPPLASVSIVLRFCILYQDCRTNILIVLCPVQTQDIKSLRIIAKAMGCSERVRMPPIERSRRFRFVEVCRFCCLDRCRCYKGRGLVLEHLMSDRRFIRLFCRKSIITQNQNQKV